jgi:hypothetical protein
MYKNNSFRVGILLAIFSLYLFGSGFLIRASAQTAVTPTNVQPTIVESSPIVPKGVTPTAVEPTEVRPTIFQRLVDGVKFLFEQIGRPFAALREGFRSFFQPKEQEGLEEAQRQEARAIQAKIGKKTRADILKDEPLLKDIRAYVEKYHSDQKFSGLREEQRTEEVLRIFEEDAKSAGAEEEDLSAGQVGTVQKPSPTSVSGGDAAVGFDDEGSPTGAGSQNGATQGEEYSDVRCYQPSFRDQYPSLCLAKIPGVSSGSGSCEVESLDKLYSQRMKQAAPGGRVSDYFADRLETIATAILLPVISAQYSGDAAVIQAAKNKALLEFKKRVFTVGGKSNTQYCFASTCAQCQELRGQCLQAKFEFPGFPSKSLGRSVNLNILFRIKDYNGQKYTLSALSYLTGEFTPSNRILKEGSTVKNNGGAFSGSLRFCAKLGGTQDLTDLPFTVSKELPISDADLDTIVGMLQ